MHSKIALLLGLLLAAPMLHAAESSDSHFYLDSKIEYLFLDTGPKLDAGASYPYPEHSFKNAPAINFSTGYNFNKTHAIELQVMYFKTETKPCSYTMPPSYSYYADPKAKLEGIPLLIGYKNRSELGKNWTLCYGVSAGVTLLHTEITRTFIGQNIPGLGSVPTYSWKDSNTSRALTYAAEIGTEYKLNERSAITAGVKLMEMGSGSDTTRGTIKAVNLGYKFRF